MEHTAEEIKRLQGCINDLISIQALPAIWSGQEPFQIVATLLDVLVHVLQLDFAYGRISDGNDDSAGEFIRVAQRRTPPVEAADVGLALAGWLSADRACVPFTAPNPLGDGNVSVAPFRLGLQNDIGILLAVSHRADFPTPTELVLLRVAVNQAVIALQEARLLSEQRRAAEELERRVVERTDQLTAADEELKKEIRSRGRAEEENRTLAFLVENSTDFIGIASLDGNVQFVNSAGQKMVGLDGDDQARIGIDDYVMEQERGRLEQQVLPSLEREGQWEGEMLFRHFKTGTAIPMLQHVFFIKEPGTERRVAIATISRDITDRKRSTEELHEVQAELARVSRVTTMGELAASIAHEVNQPLAAVVTGATAGLRWLAGDPPDLEEARAVLGRIARDANRASDVIARIRAFLKKTVIEKERLDLNEAIEGVIALAQGEIRRNEVTLRAELAADLPPLLGDRVQLQQVVLNLVINGIEAMSAVADRQREMVITTKRDQAERVCVSVRDSGTGLERMDRIFAAFYTTKPQGMGMGLSISRSIIEAHGGRLWATRNDGPGVTFQFTLPI